MLLQFMKKTDALFQSQAASFRTLENQVGQLAIAMNNCPQGALPSNTEVNPKRNVEQCQAISLRSGKILHDNILQPQLSEMKEKEKETVVQQDNVQPYRPPIPFP